MNDAQIKARVLVFGLMIKTGMKLHDAISVCIFTLEIMRDYTNDVEKYDPIINELKQI